VVSAGREVPVSERKDSDLLLERFGGGFLWIERNGVTVRGQRPEWLDWPMHTAADMAQQDWKVGKQRKGKK
jgi:hypothetical protein